WHWPALSMFAESCITTVSIMNFVSATPQDYGIEPVGCGRPGGRLVSVKDEGNDALGHFSHGNHRYFPQRIRINGGYRFRGRVGNIDNFAVGRKRDPL